MKSPPPPQIRQWISPAVSSGVYFFVDLRPHPRADLQVAFGGRERCDDTYLLERQTYPFLTLEYVAEGAGEIAFNHGAPQPLRPGSIFAHGPRVSLRVRTAPGSTLIKYFLCLTGRQARRLLHSGGPLVGRTECLVEHGEVRELFQWLLREGAEHSPQSDIACGHLLRLLLLKLTRLRARQGARSHGAHERFLAYKNHIDQHALSLNSLQEVARQLNVEPTSLSRLFRQQQGQSPYQYLLRRKMNLAAHDLLTSGDLVKTVAARTGYLDPYHFSRLFKHIHGLAPADFRALRTTPPLASRTPE
jgi:AraC family transcriptional regulator